MPVRVAIAVVEHNGCCLVGERRPTDVLPGRAEFPGGKCLPDEAAAECAVRECCEETGLNVIAERKIYACRHDYPHALLDLEFWLCRPCPAIEAATPQNGYQWLPIQALKSLDFPDANRAVIELLVRDAAAGR
jgi:8-oxo-dGTP diphosphatase